MKAALLYGKNDLRMVEIDKPEIEPTDILVKVKVCAVCPTDIRRYRTGSRKLDGQDRTFSFPLNTGHEWTGDVVKVGEEVKGFREGMRIAAGGVFGGYAEYAKIPQHFMRLGMVLELPDNVSYEEGTFVEPLADCIHAVKDRAKVKSGDTVVIIGAGPMGLKQLTVAKDIGATVIVSELMEKRLEYAKEFGADHVVNASEEDPVEAVRKLTGGWGVESVIVSIGNSLAIEQGMKMVTGKGRVVIFAGSPEGSTVRVDPNLIHYGEVVLTGSSSIGSNIELYQEALDMIASKKVPVAKLVTHKFSFDEILKAFQVKESKEGLKTVLMF